MNRLQPDSLQQAARPDDDGILPAADAIAFTPHDRRKTLLGIAITLLVHGVLLLLMINQPDPPTLPKGDATEPLSVRLIFPSSPAIAQAPAEKQEKPAERKERKKAVKRPPRVYEPPSVASVEPPPEPVAQEEPMDMSAMINAARARRQQAEETIAQANRDAANASAGPSANDLAMANIQRSLQGKRESTGGVFQVIHKGTRTGTFIFRGWKPNARSTSQQTFEVDAGLNGDVETAIVRRMIALIRTYYTGDFKWESHRLGRVLVKSARIEDTAELEAFLMREFFSDGRP